MYTPLNYEAINLIDGTRFPSQVKYRNSAAYAYWERSLFQRAASAIEWTGLPEEWDEMIQDFFKYCLFRLGYAEIPIEEEG